MSAEPDTTEPPVGLPNAELARTMDPTMMENFFFTVVAIQDSLGFFTISHPRRSIVR
jgi:hypothetical protein